VNYAACSSVIPHASEEGRITKVTSRHLFEANVPASRDAALLSVERDLL